MPEDAEDMILSEEQEKFYLGSPSSASGRNVRKGEKYRWPKAEVVYEIDPAFCKNLSYSQLVFGILRQHCSIKLFFST